MAEDVSMGAHEGGVRRADLRRAWVRAVGVLITAVRLVGNACAALLAIHVVLTVGSANPENGITRFVASWADPLALGFQDLFMPDDPKAAVLVNYGIAALFWLLATSLAIKILRALI
ncbi:hypothetical protein MOQ72_40310 [Saccharopolyspora sp. K220]|uniref:hypothetical protein n=1 Tax=Saccharopolyspora soli TaxID=2926618 RepID=UPI001F58C5D0|nr:hypothetical protein [Saccharopolyspora soli]MCI2423668.1 hypothetical protein [Saccharopolyspora soli]